MLSFIRLVFIYVSFSPDTIIHNKLVLDSDQQLSAYPVGI